MKLWNLQKAFALAHAASQDENMTPVARNVFRAIKHQIWLSADSRTQQISLDPITVSADALKEKL